VTTTDSSDVHLAVARGLLDHALDRRPCEVMVRFDLHDAFHELALPGRLPHITSPDAGTLADLPLSAVLARVRVELHRALEGMQSGQDALHVARAVSHIRDAQQLVADDPRPAT
jgi:hypothetical protein